MKQPENNQKAAIERVSQKFTPEELQHLSTLPVRKVKFAGQVHSAWYDEKSCSLYLLDENSVPTGEVRVLANPLGEKAPPRAADRAKVIAAQAASSLSEKNSVPSLLKRLPIKQKNKSNTGPSSVQQGAEAAKPFSTMKVALVSSGITAAALLVLLGSLWFVFSTKNQPPSATNQKVQVIQMSRDVLPGQLLDAADFERVTITGDLYNQIALTDSTIYSWDRVASLDGMYAATYVATGQFLTYDDVKAQYTAPANPFTPVLPDDSSDGYLTIPTVFSPEYLDDYMIGRNCDIIVSVQTQVTKPEKLDTDAVPGLNHSSSITEQVLTDTYTFKSVPILDITTMDGSSFYPRLSALNAIPDGDLEFYVARMIDELNTFMNEKTTIDEVFGQYIMKSITIQLPKEQIKAIGRLDSERTSVKIVPCLTDAKEESYDFDSVEQERFISESKYTTQVLSTMLSEAIG